MYQPGKSKPPTSCTTLIYHTHARKAAFPLLYTKHNCFTTHNYRICAFHDFQNILFSTNFPNANILNIYYKEHKGNRNLFQFWLQIRLAFAHLFTIFDFVYFFTHLSHFALQFKFQTLVHPHTKVYLNRHSTKIINKPYKFFNLTELLDARFMTENQFAV